MAQAQALDRRKFLGGSDVSGVLGLSTWATPLDIFYRKVGYPVGVPVPEADLKKRKLWRRGKLMEPVVIDMTKDELPIKITKRSTQRKPNRYIDIDDQFLAAEVDCEWLVTPDIRGEFPPFDNLTDGSTENAEVKTVHPFAARVYGQEGTDEIPVQYACQAMHGLGVTDRHACIVPVLVGSDDLRFYNVIRNDRLIKEMRARCVSFWVEHVLKGIPPPPQTLEDVHALLRIRNDIIVQADEDILAWTAQLIEASAAKSMAEKRQKDLQFQILERAIGAQALESKTVEGRHVIKHGNAEIMTVTLQGRETLKSKELKAAHPDLYAEFVKVSTFFVCRPKGGK